MPISTTWYDDEHRVILQQFDGKWTWEDATNELAVMNGLASSVSHNIVLFSDLSHTSLIPQGNIMARGRSIINQIPHNATAIIFVIQSRLIEVFAVAVFKMIPSWRNRVQFAHTVEKGRQLVAEAVAKNTAGTNAK